MTHAAIERAWLFALAAGFVVGLVLMVWWMAKVAYPRVRRRQEASGVASVRATAMWTLVHGLPGVVAFALCMVPAFHFGHLRKQQGDCRELIRVNDLQHDDPILAERCGGLDIGELSGPPAP